MYYKVGVGAETELESSIGSGAGAGTNSMGSISWKNIQFQFNCVAVGKDIHGKCSKKCSKT